MKGGKVIAVLDLVENLVSDKHALVELLGTMYHAVTNGVDFAVALDAAYLGVGEVGQDCLDGTFVVDEAQLLNLFRAVGFLEFQECVGQTYFLYAALGHCLVVIGVDKFVLHRTAAAV